MPDKLTVDRIDREPAPARGAKTLWDSGDDDCVKGFGIRIFAPTKRHPNGARSFFLNYHFDGSERRFTIGNYPTWTVKAARAEAKEKRRQVDLGHDLAAEKRERRDAPTVQDLIDRYVADHLPTKTAKGKGRENDEKRMLEEIGDHLGRDRKVADVHFGDIEAMHKKITATDSPSKSKRHRAGMGRPVRANRILAAASKMFALSLLPRAGETKAWRDAVQGNPCKGVQRNPEEGKERFYSEAEIAAISDALADVKIGSAADCLRFIMLTGCRPDEAMNASWTQMDAEPGYWVKRSAHVKQRKTHKLALNPPVLELIGGLRMQRDTDAKKGKPVSPWVFPGQRRPEKPLKQIWRVWHGVRDRATVALWEQSGNEKVAVLITEMRALRAVGDKRRRHEPTIKEYKAEAERRGLTLPAGLLDGRPYDFRHTFASVGASGRLGLPIIGRLLGHTQARTTQRYAHLADDPLKEATNKIGAVIAGAGQPGAEVKPLRGAHR
jgi:integrase